MEKMNEILYFFEERNLLCTMSIIHNTTQYVFFILDARVQGYDVRATFYIVYG
jgi:hypothetical protein